MLARWKRYFGYLIQPGVELCLKLRLSPNLVTSLGILLTIPAGYFILARRMILAGAMICGIGLADWLDGALAQRLRKSSKLGELYDTLADRFTEGILYLWLMLGFPQHALWCFLALLGSFMVSYLAALYRELKLVGLGSRPERMLVLIGSVLLGGFDQRAIEIGLILIFSLGAIGFSQRLAKLWAQLRSP